MVSYRIEDKDEPGMFLQHFTEEDVVRIIDGEEIPVKGITGISWTSDPNAAMLIDDDDLPNVIQRITGTVRPVD
jgi:hypothetical protein